MSKFKQYYLGLKFVFSYFTILPISFKKEDDLSSTKVLNSMLYFLPFMGFILGLIVIFLYGFLNHLDFLGALICAVLYMILYGFIHTEAILDVVDAVYAKHSGKDAYTVIKEPNVGAMGVLYAVSFLILKVAAITYLLLNNLFLEFISILVISRFILIFLIRFFEFRSTFVNMLKESLSLNCFIFSLLFTIIISIFLIGFKALLLLLSALLFSFFIFKFIKKTLGFLNGDALGLSLELIEILLFIEVCILWL